MLVVNEGSKAFGNKKLFSDLSLSIQDHERLAIVGPNGSGKSTLLEILSGNEELDSGSISRNGNCVVGFVRQSCSFPPEVSVSSILELFSNSLKGKHKSSVGPSEEVAFYTYLSRLGIEDTLITWGEASGGQKKRIQLALVLSQEPSLLILDEPTNHLDLESILILEEFLRSREVPSWVLVTHDRTFMGNSARRILDINPRYYRSYQLFEVGYDEYLLRREEVFIQEQQKLESLKNQARREKEWLHQGIKARGTRSKKRVERAEEIFSEVGVRSRKRIKLNSELGFASSGRKTKDLLECHSVSKSFGELCLFKDFSTKICAGDGIGLVGRNASGKSTLLKILQGLESPSEGFVKSADNLKFVHFSQEDEYLGKDLLLRNVLLHEGEWIEYLGQRMHIASWANHLGFEVVQLSQPYDSLSGGEKARARLARMITTPADVLFLDEPTNDLDIETIEVLEEMLLGFPGAFVLVSHDRRLLEAVCDSYLLIDQGITSFASLEQLVSSYRGGGKKVKDGDAAVIPTPEIEAPVEEKKAVKLSFKDQYEYDRLPKLIEEEEQKISALSELLSAAQSEGDAKKIEKICKELATLTSLVESRYRTWEELEGKQVAPT